MTKTILSSAEEQVAGAEIRAKSDLDPLLFYESQSVGNEFVPYVPVGNVRRINEARRDQLLVKSWRGVPTERGGFQSSRGLSDMRNIETQRVLDSERMFLVVLATMTLLLGTIFAYFVMNFPF